MIRLKKTKSEEKCILKSKSFGLVAGFVKYRRNGIFVLNDAIKVNKGDLRNEKLKSVIISDVVFASILGNNNASNDELKQWVRQSICAANE